MRLILPFLLACLPGLTRAEHITVFAAASTKTALDQAAAAYMQATGDTVTLSYAGSSALARQIQFGAPADLFLSANPGWMDAVEADGLLLPGSRADMLGNSLVLIAHGNTAPLEIATLPEALGDAHLAMALVDAVPAGIYGKAALSSLGLWDSLAPQVAQTDNVRAALALVALGEAPFGITYATDAAAEPRVTIVASFPADSHPPITYPVAALTEAGLPFATYLRSPEALGFFTAQGFTALPE